MMSGALDPLNRVLCETLSARFHNHAAVQYAYSDIRPSAATASYAAMSRRYALTQREVMQCEDYLRMACISWPVNLETSTSLALEIVIATDCSLKIEKSRTIMPDPVERAPITLELTRFRLTPELQPLEDLGAPGTCLVRKELGLIYAGHGRFIDGEVVREDYSTQYVEWSSHVG
jgi:hypothetical protein